MVYTISRYFIGQANYIPIDVVLNGHQFQPLVMRVTADFGETIKAVLLFLKFHIHHLCLSQANTYLMTQIVLFYFIIKMRGKAFCTIALQNKGAKKSITDVVSVYSQKSRGCNTACIVTDVIWQLLNMLNTPSDVDQTL